MRTKTKSLKLALATGVAALFAASAVASPAMADNTWISGPNLSAISIVAPSAVTVGSGVTLSTQTSTFTLNYHGSVNDAGKFAQVNFFDISADLGVTLASTPVASSTGCDQQVLGGNSHSCMFKLDGAGSASIVATVTGATSSAAMKFLLLSGPNINQTGAANITFALPKTSLKAVATTVKALAGGAAVVKFKFLDGAKAAASIRAAVAVKGISDHVSATSVLSDSQGYVWVYVANLKKKRGTSTITLTIDGTATKATSTIKWVSGKLGK